jgi:hypothetical protein
MPTEEQKEAALAAEASARSAYKELKSAVDRAADEGFGLDGIPEFSEDANLYEMQTMANEVQSAIGSIDDQIKRDYLTEHAEALLGSATEALDDPNFDQEAYDAALVEKLTKELLPTPPTRLPRIPGEKTVVFEPEPTSADLRAEQVATASAEAAAQIAEDQANAIRSAEGLELIELEELLQGENAAATIRTLQQCFLLWNMKGFSEVHAELLSRPPEPPPPDAPDWWPMSGYAGISGDVGTLSATGPNEIATPGYYSAENGTRIYLVEEEESDAPIANKLNICPGDVPFSEIGNAEYAQLMPLLKIYKVYRNKDGEEGKKETVEMEFDNKTKLDGIAKAISVMAPIGSEYSELGTYAKGTATGIKSFKWRFLGTDPYTATKDIEATLVLTFQHFSALIEERDGEVAGGNGQTAKYKYIDLVVQPDCRQLGSKVYNNVYSPECYEIRVDVGYHENPTVSLPKDTICCQRESLYLTLVDHSFSFKNDGTFELTISYRGRLETMMRDRKFNILLPGGGLTDVQFSDPFNKGEIVSIQDVEDDLLEERGKDEDVRDNAKIDELEKTKQIFFANYKQVFQSELLNKLASNGMIHRYIIPKIEWYKFAVWQQLDNPKDFIPPQRSIHEIMAQMGGTGAGVVAIPGSEEVTTPEEGEDVPAALDTPLEKIKEGDFSVNYVFFGDLLAVITDHVLGEDSFSAMPGSLEKQTLWQRIRRVEKSTTQYGKIDHAVGKDISDGFKIILDNVNVTFQGSAISTVVNLAHIPISMAAFEMFWRDKVLAKDIQFYSYFKFLDDILKEFISSLLGNECFGGFIENPIRPFSTVINSSKEISPDIFNAFLGPGQAGPGRYKTLKINNISADKDIFAFEACGTKDVRDPYDYLILSIQDRFPRNLAGDLNGDKNRGDTLGDKNRGIIHFHYGAAKGLLKTAEFSKTDQEYLPEARYVSEGNMIFNQLSNVYDATFNLLGNTLFHPGQLVYFDPAVVGAGSPWQLKKSGDKVIERSWSNIMGLGGYHLIISVDSEISRNGFFTSLKTRWVTSGQDKS